jgi:tripartite-type tricarboxylate transporter receptor subunit TctC
MSLKAALVRRRNLLRFFLLMLASTATAVRAQTYPSRPVRLIVGSTAGSSPDINARLIANWLSDQSGRSIIVENRPGAGTNIGTEIVAHAPPDGYTLLLVTLANAINVTLYPNLSFNFQTDILPIAAISREPLAMLVQSSFPAKSVPEFIAYAKRSPGKLTMGSPGLGTTPYMAGALFMMMTGIDILHVPHHSSSPALMDLLEGVVEVIFEPLPVSLGYLKAGTLRALAVTSVQRSEALPDVPVLSDFVPGYEASAYYGIGAPRGTPYPIVERINFLINAALKDPQLKSRLNDIGASPFGGPEFNFDAFMAGETEKWGNVIKAAGIKPD